VTREIRLLNAYLTQRGRRLRVGDGLHLAARTLWSAVLVAVFIELAARQWPLIDRHLWATLPLEIWLLGVFLYSLLRPLPLWRVARRLDRELRLKDRLATALELQMEGWQTGRPENRKTTAMSSSPASTLQLSNLPTSPPSSSLPDFSSLQLTDALATAQHLTPGDLPWRIPRRPLWLAGGLLSLALALVLLPNPMDAILAQRAAIQETAREQAEVIQEARREFEQSTEPTSEERAKALQALAALMKELATNPGDLEQALADLAAAEARLRELQNPNAIARQTAAEQIAAQLTALSWGESQASTDLGEASSALAELATALGAMDATGQVELAETLEAMAAQAVATDADLAQALLDLAAAARAGDITGAVNAAGKAQGALARSGQAANLQNALAAAQARLEDSRQQLAQQGALAQNRGQGQGQGQGRGQGQGQGQGRGQGQGQVGGGGGTTANQAPGANRTGVAGNPTQPNRPASISASETVYAPGSGPHLAGNPEFVAGQETGDGQTIIREERSPQPGATNPSLVPYRNVYQSYAAAAAETMERERIPTEMQDYVRDYFSQLAPE
jgi:hypothetical protein